MGKYTLKFKLKVVKYYLSEQAGFRKTSLHFGLDRSMIRKWVDVYRLYGATALKPRQKNQRYTAEFKKSVIQNMRQNYLSYRATAAKFNIPSTKMITDWEKRYNDNGINAFNDQRGCYPRVIKPKKSKSSAIPDNQKTQEELLDEIEYLRAEVAYLKKLDALIREQKRCARKTKHKL